LTAALSGVHTVLSFISWDPTLVVQKTLIKASIAAGVKRFAPTEWGMYVDLSYQRTYINC
jgi:hypothetical protein